MERIFGERAFSWALKILLVIGSISFLTSVQASSIPKQWNVLFIVAAVVVVLPFLVVLIRSDVNYTILFLQFVLILTLYEAINLTRIIVQQNQTSNLKSHMPIDATKVEGQHKLPHIFIIVFDEFALVEILKNEGVDRALVPNIAEFSSNATWYRQALSLYAYTDFSVPTILTGRKKVDSFEVEFLENFSSPNLFELAAHTHDVFISGYEMPYCEAFRHYLKGCRNFVHGFTSFRSLFLTWWERAVPGELRQTGIVRPVRDGIAGLFNPPAWKKEIFSGSLEMGQNFDRPVMTFVHPELPHTPYSYNKNGFLQWDPLEEISFDEASSEELSELRHRYREQIQFTDTLFGDFISNLKKKRIYESSLVIITSDHGTSFDPSSPGRSQEQIGLPQISRVPLFVKLPGQVKGEIDDHPISLADILKIIKKYLPRSSTSQ